MPVESRLSSLFSLLASNITDIHFTVGKPLRVRNERGDILLWTEPPFLYEQPCSELEFSLLSDFIRKNGIGRNEDFAVSLPALDIRLRVKFGSTMNTAQVFLRRLPLHIPTLDLIRMERIGSMFDSLTPGLVIVSGPTGSGKSTFLASVCARLLEKNKIHLVTIEDPVEYLFPEASWDYSVSQHQVGLDIVDFATGIRNALREDPDILLVGEIRDAETLEAALTAAETGHLVFATTHAPDTAGVIERLSGLSDNETAIRRRLASSLLAVISTRLVKTADGIPPRIPVYEAAFINMALRNNIRNGELHQIHGNIEAGLRQGMITLRRHMSDLVKSGRILIEDAQKWCDTLSE